MADTAPRMMAPRLITYHSITGGGCLTMPTEVSLMLRGLSKKPKRFTAKIPEINCLESPGLDPLREPPVIQRLPAEILTEIFSYCVCNVTRPPPQEVDSILREPWTLAQTCQYWRNIVLSLPKLWSYIHLDLSEIAPQDVIFKRDIPSMLRLWIQRSGVKHPLHIVFNDFATQTDRIHSNIRYMSQELLETLVVQSHRWAEAALCVSPFIVHLLSEIEDNIPLLHTLTLTSIEPLAGSLTVEETDLKNLLQSAPSLVNLTVNFSRCFIIDALHPPYAQLHSVSARSLAPHGLLQKSHNLKSASIRGVMFAGLTNRMVSVVTCTQLTSLELFVSPIILDFLELPALENLSIQYATDPADFRRITSLINRSSCFIRTLKLSQVTLPRKRGTTALLERLPNLVDLEVSVDKGDSDTFSGFVTALAFRPPPSRELEKTENETQSNLVTRLERIKLECPRLGAYSSNDVKHLVDMVESRWRVPPTSADNNIVQLKTIHLAAPVMRQEKLEIMRKEGLEVIGEFY